MSEENAHPHFDTADRVHVVVNGIVENYMELKQQLLDAGAVFTSETDAEVIAHLVSSHLGPGGLEDAVRSAYAQLRGHYAFVAVAADEPGVIVAARKECPLVVGRGDGEQFLGSAIPAFLAHTRSVQLIENDEIVIVTADDVRFTTADGTPVERELEEVDWSAEVAEKGGYETYMLKEIHEQAEAVAETIADRTARGDSVDLGFLGSIDDELLRTCRRIVIVACGTSYHAGLIGRYAIEEWARLGVEMDIASEYRYRNPVIGPGDLVVGISQSGETADTLAAMRLASERGATVLAITNGMGSQATRDADGVLFTRSGLEVSVAATKTFVAQVSAMYLLALRLAELRGTLDPERLRGSSRALKHMPHHIGEVLERVEEAVERTAQAHHGSDFFLYLGRHVGLPVALEGALKLKEISYIGDRRLRGRRDEARADRAARREDAGRLRGDRLAGAREGRVEHAGGPRPRRARHRGRHRGQRRDRRARRGGPLGAAHRLDAPAAAGRDPAAAPRLSHRPAARAQRRSAAQPGEDRHGRVAPGGAAAGSR